MCTVFPSMPSAGKVGQLECICLGLELTVYSVHTCQKEANEICRSLLTHTLETEGWQFY